MLSPAPPAPPWCWFSIRAASCSGLIQLRTAELRPPTPRNSDSVHRHFSRGEFSPPVPRPRVFEPVRTYSTLYSPLCFAAIVTTLALTSGCNTPQSTARPTTMPNFGPAAPDARTGAVIQQMELDYIAAKNSTRTNPHLADRAAAEKKKQEAEKAEAAKQAQAKEGEAEASPPIPPPAEPKP